jgi:hypothetical protein
MKTCLLAWCVVVGSALVGCSSDSGSAPAGGYSVTDQPMQGKLDGVAWNLATAQTNAMMSQNKDTFWTDFYGEAVPACGSAPPKAARLIVQLPKAAGEYPLSMQRNITFVVNGSDNYIATEGLLVVKEVTDTTVSGGLHAVYGDGSKFVVDGNFSASICTK